ncbi:MAG: ABC transporter substrate-binding protein, partial [Campylobacterota bacterium]|nr:ABC transporter substrate-binding protein [Campylobacterota bacterium]
MKNTKIIILFMLFYSYLLSSDDLKKVSLQLQWKHQFQFAGYYIAKERGFYKDAGFDVDIKEFEYGMNVPSEIINKNSTYGTGRPTLMINRSNGDDVVLLASIFQSSPNILLATKESGIKSIGDFKNKRIMVTGDAKEDATIMSMIFSNALSLDDLTVQEHSFDINDLINNKTDLMSSYISNEPFLLQERGIESIIFDPKDYGFNFYNDILFTTQKNINKNPKDVQMFTAASIKGWEYAFNNIEESVDMILKKYNTQNKSKKALLYEAVELKKLAYYNSDKLGKIDKDQVQKIYDYYRLMGFAKGDIDIESFIYSIHDMDFLLNNEQQQYLKYKKKITYCIDPNWMPVEKIQNGVHIGISSDYISNFSEQLGIPLVLIPTRSWEESLNNIKNGKCDIIPMAAFSSQRMEYINFTSAYLSSPAVIATKLGVPFIDDLSQ